MTLEELNRIVDEIIIHHKETKITPRELLDAFNAYRRTSGNIRIIDDYLRSHNIQTVPNYNDVWWLDESIMLQEIPHEVSEGSKKTKVLSPNERYNRIIRKSNSLKEKLTKIRNLNADLALFENISIQLQGIPELLMSDEITDKIKNILNYRLGTIESSLKKIDTFSRNQQTNKMRIRALLKDINESLNAIRFTIGTFKTLGFLNENLVAIGANGSGKTSLAENIKRYVKTNCVVIGAQKLLLVPKFNSVLDIESSQRHLREQQDKDKALKQPLIYDQDESEFRNSIADDVADEFSAVINNLLAMHNSAIHKFANSFAIDPTTPREKTILEKVFDLWHHIMPQRRLKCEDGINIMVQAEGKPDYPAYQLSDGEKVTLYLIADVMQTSNDSYIIVDEPETYLHKSIVNKLWDLLENAREKDGCIFVYLTHNIEFAESRNARKIWIKSYNTKEDLGWDIQEIPDNEIPRTLLMEILGSRKPILFCEGVAQKNGYSDAQIYEILYPQFTIKPVGSCHNVINYTRAFNKIPNNLCHAYGIVDTDFRSKEQIDALLADNIYITNVSEIENLFLNKDFIKALSRQMMADPEECFEKLQKAVKEFFIKNIELQVANYVSAQIDNFFKESNYNQANKIDELNTHFNDFCNGIRIEEWAKERNTYLESISDDYDQIIEVYNNKGLRCCAEKALDIQHFSEKAFKFLQQNQEVQETIKNILPHQLSEIGMERSI